MSLHNQIKKVLFTNEQIVETSRDMGNWITKTYENKNPLVIGLLKGCVPFMAELIKHIDCEFETDYMILSSYGGNSKSSRDVKVVLDLRQSVENRDVIIVEDVVDTGWTLLKLKNMLKTRGANDIKILTLVDKPENREVDIHADLSGLQAPKEFLVGFGLDYNEQFRGLPYIGILDPKFIK